MSDGNPNAWTTGITSIAPNEVRIRGYDITDLMGRVSFGAMVHLLLRGDLPDAATGRLLEAILVSSVDHGATPPSALAARTVASTGAATSAAVAAGILSMNRHHGGTIGDCARQLGALLAREEAKDGDLDAAAAAVVDDLDARHARMSGFGSRIHDADPRTARLFALADEARAAGPYVAAARALERVFASRGRPLPINVEGAIGAILADLGYDPDVMSGFFMIARSAGLVAQVREEQSRMQPMRRIDPVAHAYDGPRPRSVDDPT